MHRVTTSASGRVVKNLEKITCWTKSAHCVAPSQKQKRHDFLAPLDRSRRDTSIAVEFGRFGCDAGGGGVPD